MIAGILLLATLWFGLDFIRDLVNLALMLVSKTDKVLSAVITLGSVVFLAVVLLISPEVVTHVVLAVVLLIRIVDEYPRSFLPEYLETLKEFRKENKK
jgi:hypothetical protein